MTSPLTQRTRVHDRPLRTIAGCGLLLVLALPSPSFAQSADTAAPQVTVRGFGDLGFIKEPGAPGSFALGQLDTFVTATLSDRVSLLVEAVAEAGSDNAVVLDLERAIARYTFSDRLRVGIGRYHTTIGFYNTAYHHGMWFQTAASRPTLFEFEDEDGVLPIHQVGLMFDGRIPSGGMGLRWFAEIGNGRAPSGLEAVQNAIDADNRKAFVLALSSQPDRVHGLTFGASYYRDRFQHHTNEVLDEQVVTAHAVLLRPNFEWLNEVARISHGAPGGTPAVTYSGYTQVAKQVGPLKPYARFEAFSSPVLNPLLEHAPDGATLLFGARRELAPAAALKVEMSSHRARSGAWTHGATAQVSFVF